MKEYIERSEVLAKKQRIAMFGLSFLDYVDVEDIQSVSAVDVKPVVRGKWERVGNTNHFKCSCCNKMILAIWDMPSTLFNYCYNCGADMRDDVNNEN